MKLWTRFRTRHFTTEEARAVAASIYEAPRSAIADLPEHTTVAIGGRVIRGLTPLAAPLTRRPCVFWRVRIEGKNAFGSARGSVPFIVEDRGHRALVDASAAKIVLRATNWVRVWEGNHQPVHVALLEQIGTSLANSKHFELAESIVELGQSIDLVGTAERVRDPERHSEDYRDAGTVMRFGAFGMMDPTF